MNQLPSSKTKAMDENGSKEVVGNSGSKVHRVIDKYGLEGVGEELENRWLGNGYNRTSLRVLATFFNKQVLKAALTAQDHQPTQESIETTFNILVNNESNTASKTRIKRELQKAGIDVDTLQSDFVSHQAIHTFLTKHRNATLPNEDGNKLESAERTINKLKSRMVAVSESNLQRLFRNEELTETDVEVFVDVTVFCNECGTSRTINEYLQAGGCDCILAD